MLHRDKSGALLLKIHGKCIGSHEESFDMIDGPPHYMVNDSSVLRVHEGLFQFDVLLLLLLLLLLFAICSHC